MNIRRIIKEELLKEAGGYDSPEIMAQHAGHVMHNLKTTIKELNLGLMGFVNLLSDPDISHLEMGEEIESLNDLILDTKLIVKIVTEEFTEDKLVEESKNLIKKLDSLEGRIKFLNNLKFDYTSGQYKKSLAEKILDFSNFLSTYIKTIIKTDETFGKRLSGKNRGWSGDQISIN
jgi:hypothetical protein